MCAYPSWKFTNEVVVVEGPMDALAAAECGFDSIALMGINPGKLALEHLVTLIAKRNTLILLDGEPEATKAAYEIAMHVSSTGIRAIVATLSGVKDLAKASFSYRKSFLEMYMEDFRS
jgi:DNA primase